MCSAIFLSVDTTNRFPWLTVSSKALRARNALIFGCLRVDCTHFFGSWYHYRPEHLLHWHCKNADNSVTHVNNYFLLTLIDIWVKSYYLGST